MLKTVNLAVKLLLELVTFGAFGYWGAAAGRGVLAILLAIAAPAAAIVVWGLFTAPRAKRRLPVTARIPLELAVFGLAAASLATAGSLTAAIAFGVVTVTNSMLLTVFHQWDQSESSGPGSVSAQRPAAPAGTGASAGPGPRGALALAVPSPVAGQVEAG